MARVKKIKIRKKALFKVGISVILLMAVIFLTSWVAVMGGFSNLEKMSVERNISRSQEVVADKLNNLNIKLSDWTIWDDTYAFIEDKNEAYIKSNLTSLILDNLQLDMMLFLNLRGELVYHVCRDHDQGTEHVFLKERLSALSMHRDETNSITGIVMLQEGPLLVASRPIVKSDGKGPIRGTILFVSRLNAEAMEHFSRIIRAEMSVEEMSGVPLSADFIAARAAFLKGETTFIKTLGAKTVAGYCALKDISGKEALILKVAMPREITQFGMRTLIYFFIALIVVGLIFGAVVYMPLEKEITRGDWAEEGLKDSEERFRALFEYSPDGLYLCDLTGVFIDANKMAEELTGIPKEESIGKNFFQLEILPLSETPKVIAGLAQNTLGHPTGPIEYELQRNDGSRITVEARTYPVKIGGRRLLLGSARDVSERKKTEEALRRSEEKYRLLSENATDVLWALDIATQRFTYFSPSVKTMRGYTSEEAMALSLDKTLLPESYQRAVAQIKESLLREATYGPTPDRFRIVEYQEYCKDGSTIFVEVKSKFTRDKEGKATGITGITRDVTERKKAEEALAKSEAMLKCIVSAAPIGIAVGVNRIMDWLNDYFLELTGYSREEMIGKDVRMFYETEEEYNRVGKAFYDGIREKGMVAIDMRWKHKSGRLLDIYARGAALYPPDTSRGIIFTITDVTEFRQAEKSLRESEKRFMDILYASKDAILLIDGDKFVDCNDATAQMLGYSTRQEFLMKHPSELSPPQQPDGRNSYEKANEMMRIAFEQGFHRFEWIHRKADGEDFPVEVSLMPIAIRGKNVIHCLWRDMTENKQLAEALKKSHENLESQVKERTEELVLSFQRLQATDEELRRASKAKSEFLANMSHELRTPLNSIIGFSEVLYDERFGPLNERQKRYAQNVTVSGRHLLSLINDVLDLSKVEAGKMVLEPSSFPFRGCVEEVLQLMENQVFTKKIKPAMEIPENFGEIYGDERKIKQIIYNLLSNAIKFTPEGGKVGIRGRRIDVGVEVTIWDTGIGVSSENLEKVFGAFERLGNTYTQETEGTGLGLTISRKMVELHGGRIWIESEGIGKGSIVKFIIPSWEGAK